MALTTAEGGGHREQLYIKVFSLRSRHFRLTMYGHGSLRRLKRSGLDLFKFFEDISSVIRETSSGLLFQALTALQVLI